jgi:hypothetical protein
MLAAIGLLAAVTVTISAWPEPLIVYANHAAQALVEPHQYIAAVLQPPWSGEP